jgi:hypothetical protein
MSSNIKLNHIPLFLGSQNYLEWVKAMRYTLLAEDLWKYIVEGQDKLNFHDFGIQRPMIDETSSAACKREARVHGEQCLHELIHPSLTLSPCHSKHSTML